ncbi:hypothetical protein UlMin_013844 [Ulmus minor]
MDDAVGVGAEDGDNHGDNDADEQLHSSSEQSSEDSDDPGWKQDLYESSESSEDDVSLVNSFDGSGVATELDYHSSEEDCLKQGKRTNDRGSYKDVDPSKNIPRGPPLYDSRGRVVLSINQQFNDHVHFRTFLLDYAIQEGFTMKKIKAARYRMTYRCSVESCPWRVHASLSPCKTFFILKTLFEDHTCQVQRSNKHVSATWIAEKLGDDIRSNPNMNIHGLEEKLKDLYGLTGLCRRQIYRAREKALGGSYESHSHEFKMLRVYANMILRTNPGSVATVGFVAGCRPFIRVDGCHLKGSFGGVLLAAISMDANLMHFPVAYAIVEIENGETWAWFFNMLKDDVGQHLEQQPWTIISDRQKGLVQVVSDLLPNCSHRRCCQHVWKNMLGKFSDNGLRDLFWEAAKATTVAKFTQVMLSIRARNRAAAEWLELIEPKHWSFHAMDPNAKMEHITSNFVESFNAVVGATRYKPPVSLLETIRIKVMDLIYTRKVICERWTKTLPPRVSLKVDFNGLRVGVRLDEGHCDCRAWTLSGLPCVHALACINMIRANVDEYVSPYFTMNAWRACLSATIHPIPSESLWPVHPPSDLLEPPAVKRLAGRPRKHRNRQAGESRLVTIRSATVTCSFCHLKGHNMKGCPKKRNKAEGTTAPKKGKK